MDFLVRLKTELQAICVRENCELYDLEFVTGSKGKGRVLRVFVDKEGGATLEDCSNVSKSLSDLLDAEDIIPGESYSLEVSTPGLERVLREPRHFKAAIGKKMEVRTNESMDLFNPQIKPGKRLNAKGVLVSASEDEIEVEGDGMRLKIPIKTIAKANLVFDFEGAKGQKK